MNSIQESYIKLNPNIQYKNKLLSNTELQNFRQTIVESKLCKIIIPTLQTEFSKKYFNFCTFIQVIQG